MTADEIKAGSLSSFLFAFAQQFEASLVTDSDIPVSYYNRPEFLALRDRLMHAAKVAREAGQ